jgi:hypothetical protein
MREEDAPIQVIAIALCAGVAGYLVVEYLRRKQT